MRKRRLIVVLLVALATVGIVGALVVRGAEDTGGERTLSSMTDSVADSASAAGATGGEPAADAAATAGEADAATSNGAGSGRGQAAVPPGRPGGADGSAPAATYLPIDGLTASQTYRASVEIVGWRDREAGLAEVVVRDAGLLGAVDPATGQPTGQPADPALDRSGYVEGRRLLATVTAQAAADLPGSGMAVVHLVFVPSGPGAVFWIDRVTE